MSKSLHWPGLPDNLKDRVMEEESKVVQPKKSKYGSKKTEFDGVVFDSKKEASYYQELLMLQKAGEVIDIELQPKFFYEIHYQQPKENYPISQGNSLMKRAFYRADFKVVYTDGRVEIVDCKGFKTSIYKQKKKIIETLYGIIIIEK